MRAAGVRRWVLPASWSAALVMVPALVAAQLVERSVEPVVITGADLPSWSRLVSNVACAP